MNAEEIRKRNEEFERLSPDQKRVTVAKDLLKRLEEDTMQATFGDWLTVSQTARDLDPETEVQTIINDPRVICSGCLIGGLVLCAIDRHNQLKVGSLVETGRGEICVDQREAFEYLEQFFDPHQLRMMEIAFETGGGGCAPMNEEEWDASEFEPGANSSHERMNAILRNVVVNNGTFKPPVPAHQM